MDISSKDAFAMLELTRILKELNEMADFMQAHSTECIEQAKRCRARADSYGNVKDNEEALEYAIIAREHANISEGLAEFVKAKLTEIGYLFE
jgi:hypothetical protein